MERAKMITIGLIVGGALLAGGIFALMWFLMIKPEREVLAEVEEELAAEQAVADQLETTEADLAAVTEEWLQAQEELQQLRRERSRPISFGHPAAAMTTLWYEYREDLPPLIEDWILSTGCTIESSASFPAPAMTPPAAPPSGFLQVPDGQTITLTVGGSLTDIERLYHSLHMFPRVATVSQLVLQPTADGRMQAPVPFKFYLIVENPPGVAAPAAPGMDPGMDVGMPADMMDEMYDGGDDMSMDE